ncbi:MAG: Unknown protein [uncultured Sulfurovum sp.]|uniref:Uncharacterized protein n=1 Tax=uncultured Sulfurovum sp. TaxID=269237 RepID=A0A6S6T9P0_9BACT|nr:MAG: Unknown protein [uncultured Sulfurovum sp.]
MDIATAFRVMMKGVIVSRNSAKYGEIATFLLNEENYIEYETLLQTLGYELNGENGYFYLSKSNTLSSDEIEQFVQSHKEVFMLISILKQLLPHVRSGSNVKYTEFVAEFEIKKDLQLEEKWQYIFKKTDRKQSSEKFFERLEKEFIVEKIDKNNKDSYLVLNSLDYYLSFLESMI